MNPRFHSAILTAALAALYFLAGKFGLSLAVIHPCVSPIWPASGLALGALLLGGYRLWPGVFIGALLVNATALGSVAAGLGMACGVTLEALAGAWLVHRFAGGTRVFERAQTIFQFLIWAAMVSPIFSAGFGVTSLCLAGRALWQQYPEIWLTWWLGDLVGILVVTPLLVIWMAGSRPPWNLKSLAEALVLFAGTVLTDWLVFWDKAPFAYLSILPLLWAAFRFGGHGAVAASFLTSGIALYGTWQGMGPFAVVNRNTALLDVQAFMAVVSVAALVLAALVAERRKFEQRLQIRDAVSRVLAEAATWAEAGPQILQALGQAGGWEWSAIWNMERATNKLFCASLWHSPALALPAFAAVSRQSRFAPGEGLPGRVWASGQPEWISNVARACHCPRAEAARREGLRSALGIPIELNGTLVGVIECFSRQFRLPDAEFLEMIRALGIQVGQFMERKRIEQAARESQRQFQEMAENIREVFWMTDASIPRTVLYVSPAYQEIWGRSCESLYAAPGDWMEAIHPEDRDRIRQAVFDRQVRGEYDETYRIIRPDGAVRWVHDRAFPVRDESGQVIRIVGVAEDVTARKLAEARLTMLVSAVESTGELICITDLQDRFTFANRAFLRAYGYALPEILGHTLHLLWSPRNPPGLVEEILEHTHQGGWRGEVLSRRKDGAEFTVFLSTSQIKDSNGHVIGLMGVAHDITEQRRMEREILEISARERQRIGFELHDGLGQHLAGIAYKTQSLVESLAGDGAARMAAREIVDLVNDAMRQTRQLARNLEPLEVEAYGLVTALERLAADTQRQFPVECRFFCQAPSVTVPRQTSLALYQIAQEAVRNALVHGGAERIDLNLMIDSRRLHLKIRDYGKGFEPARQQSTTGMGLRLMRYRAGAVGGVVHVSSRPGDGTVVQCSVPFPLSARQPAAQPITA